MPLISLAFTALLLGADADAAELVETDCAIEAIAYEAMGESVRGKRAVAEVIMNRQESQYYQESICSIVYRPGQFEFVQRRQRGQKLPTITDEIRMQAAQVWFSYKFGDMKRNVLRPCHTTFINPEIVRHRRGGSLPDWWQAGSVPISIGNHEFRCEPRTFAAYQAGK